MGHNAIRMTRQAQTLTHHIHYRASYSIDIVEDTMWMGLVMVSMADQSFVMQASITKNVRVLVD